MLGKAFGKRPFAARLTGLAGLAVFLSSPLPLALAETEVVPLERLHVHDVILLPTVRSQYEAKFTKPKTWQVAPSSAIDVEFQHSHELLPNRSWLQVRVNDKMLKHIPLTKENVNGTKVTIPMPVALLKDFNTLTFRVEQHYTDKCEDPLDKSLWTQVLPASKLVFNYTPVVPEVNLGLYPYPVIDPLTYSAAQVQYVTSAQSGAETLQALAQINTHLAQQAQEHELTTRAAFSPQTGPDSEHLVFVGTPAQLPAIAQYQASFGDYTLSGGRWTNRKTGQTLQDNQGVILFFAAPGSKEKTILVVSGNTDQGVLRAAEYLTQKPRASSLMGTAAEVPEGWSPPGNRSAKVPRFVENQTRTFRELGFPIQEVHKINAPPITYHVPIVGDFRPDSNNSGRLWLDINYSYSPKLNPEYSSLELRMNDVSIANIPLTNPDGEQHRRASIPISNELIKVRNNLVAQFHLMPDKYGWCVDNYVDNAWGKIMDDSQFRVEGGAGNRLPDIGLLNNTMYPYSANDNLQDVQIALPASPTAEVLDAMLGFTSRLGRATLADAGGLNLRVSKGTDNIQGKYVAAFRYSADAMNLPSGTNLSWQTSGNHLLKVLSLAEINNAKFSGGQYELGKGVYMEQYGSGDKIISVFTASEPAGFLGLGRLFESDKEFETLTSGFIQQLSQLNPKQINPVNATSYHSESGKGGSGNWFEDIRRTLMGWPWMKIILGAVGFFIFLLILPVLIRRITRR